MLSMQLKKNLKYIMQLKKEIQQTSIKKSNKVGHSVLW